MKNTQFIHQLAERIHRINAPVNGQFEAMDESLLNFKMSLESWSILECLEHLNRYSRYYNAQMEKCISSGVSTSMNKDFQASWLGKKIIESVEPGNTKKQKTFRHMNPNNSQLDREVIREFRQHQTQLLLLLESAQSIDLNKRVVPIEFFKWLKMSIGEALLFLIAHQERHIQQAMRIKLPTLQVR